jgi:hypothetical protein
MGWARPARVGFWGVLIGIRESVESDGGGGPTIQPITTREQASSNKTHAPNPLRIPPNAFTLTA